ncbi:MAG: nucleotidyl transferase AbiEii/AbiGii toxin family protein [Candidatus Competibacteraceae bacterium]
MRSIRIDRPLDPALLRILEAVDHVVADYGIDCFVTGAMARDILLTHVFGIDTGRATRDVDFAIAVASWDQFNLFKARLVSGGSFTASDKLVQRLYYRDEARKFEYPIDLVPFGGVEQIPHTFAWPPELDVMMNVAGYEDALKTAEHVQVNQDLIIRVASLPSLAMLKLFAWKDRGLTDSKDAVDLLTIMRRYSDAGNQDRLYSEAFDILESARYDPHLASACLLGADIARRVSKSTCRQLIDMLSDTTLVDRLVLHLARSLKDQEDSQTVADALIGQFKTGLGIGPSR